MFTFVRAPSSLAGRKNQYIKRKEGELHNNNIDPNANLKMRENLLGLVFIMLIKCISSILLGFYIHSASHKALRRIFMFHLCLKKHVLLDNMCNNY